MLQLLESGCGSDIDLSDEEEYESLRQLDPCPRNSKRAGADEIGSDDVADVDPNVTEDCSSDHHVCGGSLLVSEEDGDVITTKNKVKWKKGVFMKPDTTFHENAVVSDDVELLSPLSYFKRYIKDSDFDKMAEYTNIYALQNGDTNFKPTNSAEIQSLFALHIATGTLGFPRVRLFWDRTLGIQMFQDEMSRDRFFRLRRNLHIVNNLEIPENCNDRLYKVRPLYNAVRDRCLQLKLEENLCIDEQIVPFRGHLSIKQYIKGKPTPWGIKIFVLCGQSGQAYDFIIYQGSLTEIDKGLLKIFGLGATVVLKLAERIDQGGHKLFYDNYFSSYQLLQVLKSKGIYAGGTVRINRFSNPPVPSDKELKKRNRGSYDEVVSTDGIVLVKWMDNRSVCLASNFVGSGEEDTVKRWSMSLFADQK